MSQFKLNENPFEGIKRGSDERINQQNRALEKSFKTNSTKISVGTQIVGSVKNGIFFKRIHGSRHFLRKPLAISFDNNTITEAQEAGATRVEILNLEDGKVYLATIAHILEKGIRINRGFGDQVALPLSYWQVKQTGKIETSKWGKK
jgi:translation initiation factor IF-1